jgi:hypothetical protein
MEIGQGPKLRLYRQKKKTVLTLIKVLLNYNRNNRMEESTCETWHRWDDNIRINAVNIGSLDVHN